MESVPINIEATPASVASIEAVSGSGVAPSFREGQEFLANANTQSIPSETSNAPKKIRLEKSRKFLESWTYEGMVIERKDDKNEDRIFCIVESCRWSTLSHRFNNIKDHYKKKHRKYHGLSGDERKETIKNLISAWEKRRQNF